MADQSPQAGEFVVLEWRVGDHKPTVHGPYATAEIARKAHGIAQDCHAFCPGGKQRVLLVDLSPKEPAPAASHVGEWVLVPATASHDWAYAIATRRQGRSETPLCEPPSPYAVGICRDWITDVLAAAPAAPPSASLLDAADAALKRMDADVRTTEEQIADGVDFIVNCPLGEDAPPSAAPREDYLNLANALESADWSGMSIGNKAMIRAAVERLRATPPSASAARIAALERALGECVEDLAERIEDHYVGKLDYPSEQRRYERDMEPVVLARALLSTKEGDNG